MPTIDLRTPVSRLVAEQPNRARVFERLGVDYCCHGNEPLDEACRERGLDPEDVAGALDVEATGLPPGEDVAWSELPISSLVAHIVLVHHAYLRRELPRLRGLIERARQAHDERHPELKQLQAVFVDLQQELEQHMFKEERVLFPMILELEQGRRSTEKGDGPLLPERFEGCFAQKRSVPFFGRGVNAPIEVMEQEHERAATALARMRKLTRGYEPPADACPTYRTMLDGLAALEEDLHLHVHEENNILFPRAAFAEADLSTL